jgi:hypothetical protein
MTSPPSGSQTPEKASKEPQISGISMKRREKKKQQDSEEILRQFDEIVKRDSDMEEFVTERREIEGDIFQVSCISVKTTASTSLICLDKMINSGTERVGRYSNTCLQEGGWITS